MSFFSSLCVVFLIFLSIWLHNHILVFTSVVQGVHLWSHKEESHIHSTDWEFCSLNSFLPPTDTECNPKLCCIGEASKPAPNSAHLRFAGEAAWPQWRPCGLPMGHWMQPFLGRHACWPAHPHPVMPPPCFPISHNLPCASQVQLVHRRLPWALRLMLWVALALTRGCHLMPMCQHCWHCMDAKGTGGCAHSLIRSKVIHWSTIKIHLFQRESLKIYCTMQSYASLLRNKSHCVQWSLIQSK